MMLSKNQLKDELNLAAVELRKAEEMVARLHQDAMGSVLTAVQARADEKWTIKDADQVNLEISISGRLFKNLLEAKDDVDSQKDFLRDLRLQMAERLEREAQELRRLTSDEWVD